MAYIVGKGILSHFQLHISIGVNFRLLDYQLGSHRIMGRGKVSQKSRAEQHSRPSKRQDADQAGKIVSYSKASGVRPMTISASSTALLMLREEYQRRSPCKWLELMALQKDTAAENENPSSISPVPSLTMCFSCQAEADHKVLHHTAAF